MGGGTYAGRKSGDAGFAVDGMAQVDGAYFIQDIHKVVVVENGDKFKDTSTYQNKCCSYNKKSNSRYELNEAEDKETGVFWSGMVVSGAPVGAHCPAPVKFPG